MKLKHGWTGDRAVGFICGVVYALGGAAMVVNPTPITAVCILLLLAAAVLTPSLPS